MTGFPPPPTPVHDLPAGATLYAGMGVAMGNARPEIQEQADIITASNEEDGVAEAIERYVLE